MVAKRVGPPILDGRRVALIDRLLYVFGEALIYGPLRNVARHEPGPRRLYSRRGDRARSVHLLPLARHQSEAALRMTESSVFLCIQRDGAVKPDTVVRRSQDVEIRISRGRRGLVPRPGMFRSYYKRPEATAQASEPDGWVQTGDAGFFDADGQLKIIDRAKDVGRLATAPCSRPNTSRTSSNFSPISRRRWPSATAASQCTAFINIDIEAVGNWAERRGIAYSGYTELAAEARSTI